MPTGLRRTAVSMKLLVVIAALLVGLTAAFALQPRARLIFPAYDQVNNVAEFYYARDFVSPSACEDGLSYYPAAPDQTARAAECRYAPRYYVWGLMARYIAHRLARAADVYLFVLRTH